MRQISRYIPKDSEPVTDPRGLGVVYISNKVHPDGKIVYSAIAYAGDAGRNSFHYTYRTAEQRREDIGRFFANLWAHKKLVAERRAADFAGHKFVAGDIVTNSWGYDQTNVDWYRVTRTTKSYVWLKPVRAILDAATGAMAGEVALQLDENLKPIDGQGKETKHRASGEYVTMRHGCGSKYMGGTLYQSWYA